MRTVFPMLLLLSVVLQLSCSHQGLKKSPPGYPDAWWKEVPRAEAKSWEILPQDAKPGEVILSKRTELGLFSNFASTPFLFRGQCYRSIEGLWQMMKFPETPQDPRWSWKPSWSFRRADFQSMEGTAAKKASHEAIEQMKAHGVEWVTFEGKRLFPKGKDRLEFEQLIRAALIEKLRQNPDVYFLLMKTKDLRLAPDHHIDPEAPRAWKYHELWMGIRAELRSGSLVLEDAERKTPGCPP